VNSFVADPLTPSQIKQLHAEEQDVAPAPDVADYVLANGEYIAMDILANLMILRHFDILRSSDGRPDWFAICIDMHLSLLTANGPLRPVFLPHAETFIMFIHAVAFGVQLNNCGHRLDLDDFHAWIERLVNKLGERRIRQLVMEMDRGGLFVAPLRPRVLVPMGYREQPHLTTAGVLHIMEVCKKEPSNLQRIATKLSPRRLVRRLTGST
jgi:hypothetical protein